MSGIVHPGGLPATPPCPFCTGAETELANAFGSHASVATYWCRKCRSPFELLKWRPEGEGTIASDSRAGNSGAGQRPEVSR
jgi:hypothetical protein